MRSRFSTAGLVLAFCLAATPTDRVRAEDGGWTDLTRLDVWKSPTTDWFLTDAVGLDPKNPKLLSAKPGEPGPAAAIMVNGPKGRSRDIYTKEQYGDVEIRAEFMIPTKSNSGIKFQGVYEIQIFDSYGKKADDLTGADCGGIYPRAEFKPNYHHIDKGYAPRTNACKAPGEWQSLDIIFLAPKFGADGKKTANARFLKVVLNGQVVQDDVEVKSPTGHNWTKQEVPTGPIMLQADHGPVAFRNIKVRPYAAGGK